MESIHDINTKVNLSTLSTQTYALYKSYPQSINYMAVCITPDDLLRALDQQVAEMPGAVGNMCVALLTTGASQLHIHFYMGSQGRA